MKFLVKRIGSLVLILSLSLPNPASAVVSGSFGDNRWYYKIGGADAVMAPLNAKVTSATVSGSLNLGLGFNCSSFDPVLGISTGLNNAINNIRNVLTTAVSSAISSLPALILQRASPGLYELYQELLAYANGAITLATKSCEQMQSDIAKGNNPYEHWLTLSKSYSWRDQMGKSHSGSSSVDVVTALSNVDNKGGDEGVPWVGGKNAGGKNQTPIKVVSDVVKAGYNIELNRGATTSGSLTKSESDTRVGQVWKSPDDAANYATAVLGDIEIQTKNNASRNSTPGHGLAPKIEKDRQDMSAALSQLVNGDTAPSPDELSKVSAPGTQLTRDVIESIRRLQPQERSVVIGKLAAEAATAANVERAMMLRRLLLTGHQEPHVYASEAGPEIQRLVAIVDREVDTILYETRVRKELFAGTAATVLELGRTLDNRSGNVPGQRTIDTRPVENGAVVK